MAVTEIALLTIKPGRDADAEGTEAYQARESMCKTISEQEGVLGIWYGLEIEKPSVLDLIVEWENISYHKRFMAMEIYKPFVSHIQSDLVSSETGSLIFNHVHFRTPFTSVVSAPVIEMVTMYLPNDCDTATTEKTMDEFFAVLDSNAEGHRGNAHGWIEEELEHEKVEGRTRGYYFAIGWDSIEKHMKYRETKPFAKSVPMLREISKAMSMHHTSFKKWSP